MSDLPATGVSRRAERYGASSTDAARDALRDRLRAFEKMAEGVEDPAVRAALEEMRRETRELERFRGVWCVARIGWLVRDVILFAIWRSSSRASSRRRAGIGVDLPSRRGNNVFSLARSA